MATLFVDKADPQSGTSLEIGSSGDTITIPSGATITNSGTANNFGGSMTPSFFASKTDGNQTLSDATATKVTFNTELYDTNNAYASNKFTVKRHIVYFYKNNSQASMANNDFQSNLMVQMFSFHSVVFDLSVGDYIEVYSLNDTNDGGSSVISSSGGKFETWFSAYKLIL